MHSVFIPTEEEFKRWIKEAVQEALCNNESSAHHDSKTVDEPLLTRKEVAGMFRITLVTLHDWMRRGLPNHKQGGRVYFLRSEVLAYVKSKKRWDMVADKSPVFDDRIDEENEINEE